MLTTEKTSEKVMVVSTLDTFRVGEEFKKVPVHLTLAPWFNLPVESWDYFNREMGEIVLEHSFSPTIAGNVAAYGPGGEEEVRRLNHPDLFTVMQLFPVHAAVFELAYSIDPEINATYSRVNYSPHMSSRPDRTIADGEVIDLSNLTVFERRAETGRKLVKAVYLWDKING